MSCKEHLYHVYILTNQYHTVFYTGVIGRDLKRIVQHKQKVAEGFTSRYNLNKLVLWEEFEEIKDAIRREKQIKNWSRKKKVWLIDKKNPDWKDLFPTLFKEI